MFVCLFVSWPCHVACRILVPQLGIEPGPLAVEARNPNHWTTKEFPLPWFFVPFLFFGGGGATWHVDLKFPDQGQNLRSLHWTRGVLTTGPPGKSEYRSSESGCTLHNADTAQVCSTVSPGSSNIISSPDPCRPQSGPNFPLPSPPLLVLST